MAAQPVLQCIRDTRELDFNGQQIEGLGPLSYEAQRGMYLHPALAASPARQPPGVLDAWMPADKPKAEYGTRPGEKESTRWVEGCTRVAEMAGHLAQTRLIYVRDRESDMLELMVPARDNGYAAHDLLCSRHGRVVPESEKLSACCKKPERCLPADLRTSGAPNKAQR
jgi:hypothetical protein